MDYEGDFLNDPNDNVSGCIKPTRELITRSTFKVYKRRWFVLLVLCLLNSSNAALWLTFAPVADQSAQYLHATLDQVNWLSLVYMVVAIPLSFGTTWMIDSLGLRITLILGSWLNMLGALLRLFGTFESLGLSDPYPLVMSGQTLCAVAQPLVIFAPTKMAALWFSENQRATANMIASMSNPVGLLFANILSPLIVTTNDRIPLLMLVYAIPACLVCFLATVGLRSSGPPTPPSASAESSTSEPFIQGLKLLLRNRPYLVLLVCFGCGIAVFTCFSSLLEQILCVRGYSNFFAGLCGSLFIVFGVVGAGVLGLFVDKTKMFTEVTKVNMALSALACIAFAVVSQMRQQEVAVAAACSLFGLFGFAIYPVAMELCVECTYPVGEATSTGLIFVSGQVQSVVLMVALQALTRPLADSPFSTCSIGGDPALSWRVSVLVMAGVFAALSCLFIIIFNSPYRRILAEAKAAQSGLPSFKADCIDTVSQAVCQGTLEPSIGTKENEELDPGKDC
ncbi:solute carrier family 49 member A3 [Gadus chalcogrammus]|uniref:solute carrier family 49 member A3 n=1 Tax=Gadus chalcogrammus TaxID=1042646 RepID=UPI0024C4840C|nr:solute carrier family 49 member A3 [Gadus chalcogrammus]